MKYKKYGIIMLLCIALTVMAVSGCGKSNTPIQPDNSDQSMLEEEDTEGVSELVTEMEEESEEVVPEVSEVESEEPSEEVSEEPSEEVSVEPLSDGGAQGYFTTTDINGNEITQAIFAQSDLTVFNVWATYCGPCINEMPYLGELSQEYDAATVQIIGLPLDATNSDMVAYAKSLVEQTGANYTHLLYSADMYDWGFSEIQYVPTTYFVDSEGNVLDVVVGSMSKEDWKKLIDEKLASL